MNYRLDVFRDTALSDRAERLSLSARSDEQAVEQAEAARWRFECAGESRVLVLSRCGVEIARLGSRKHGGVPRWSVTVLDCDGGWPRVTVDAPDVGEAIDYAFSLDWVENVIECRRVVLKDPSSPAVEVGDDVEFDTASYGPMRGTVADVGCGRDRPCDIMVERHPETGAPCIWKNVPESAVRPIGPGR